MDKLVRLWRWLLDRPPADPPKSGTIDTESTPLGDWP